MSSFLHLTSLSLLTMKITPEHISLSVEETFDLLYSVNRYLWEQVLDELADAVEEIYQKETGMDSFITENGVSIGSDSINYCRSL